MPRHATYRLLGAARLGALRLPLAAAALLARAPVGRRLLRRASLRRSDDRPPSRGTAGSPTRSLLALLARLPGLRRPQRGLRAQAARVAGNV